jgi:hypothetical protein
MNELTEGINALAERRNMNEEQHELNLVMTTKGNHFIELIKSIEALHERAKVLESCNAFVISLDPKRPICTKCVRNLFFYDGWHCMCEEEDVDHNCWVNFKQTNGWEKCADDLVDYAHEFVAHLSTWGKGYDRYDKDIKKAEDAIEEHKRLKNHD